MTNPFRRNQFLLMCEPYHDNSIPLTTSASLRSAHRLAKENVEGNRHEGVSIWHNVNGSFVEVGTWYGDGAQVGYSDLRHPVFCPAGAVRVAPYDATEVPA